MHPTDRRPGRFIAKDRGGLQLIKNHLQPLRRHGSIQRCVGAARIEHTQQRRHTGHAAVIHHNSHWLPGLGADCHRAAYPSGGIMERREGQRGLLICECNAVRPAGRCIFKVFQDIADHGHSSVSGR